MANRLFRKYVQHLMTGGALDLAAATLKVAAVDTAVDDPDTTIGGDEFLSHIAAAVVTTTGALDSVTVVDGVLDAANETLPDTGGAQWEKLVLFADTGNPATSRLIALFDTAAGMPLTPDNVADLLEWHASGIFAL